jgi:hypothetical protein
MLKTKYKNLLTDLIKDTKNGIFNEKEFKHLHADKSYLKTPIYHFFDSKTEFEYSGNNDFEPGAVSC